MEKRFTPQEWVDENVNFERLIHDVARSMAEAVRNENIEDGTYTALVYDIVSGACGQYIPVYALQFFNHYVDTDIMDDFEKSEFIHDDLESFANEVADIINNDGRMPNEVTLSFGYWEADGTYCLMAHIDEDDIKNLQYESFNFIGEMMDM